MRVLIIKLSSLGDIIHSLPALSDAAKRFPEIRFDWVVEENFAAIPTLHPHVNRIIPIAARRWRKNWFRVNSLKEIFAFLKNLRREKYDYVIDAQGLMKSAVVAFFSRGTRAGFSRRSARESWASLFYQKQSVVSLLIHAIPRIRKLFAYTFDYIIHHDDHHGHHDETDYGIDRTKLPAYSFEKPYVVFLHATTWGNKHWPVEHWISLGKKLNEFGLDIHLLWANPIEKARAETIQTALGAKAVRVCPKMNLVAAASVLANARAVVSVDTGLGHLAAALKVPTIGLFGPTPPSKSGIQGKDNENLQAVLHCIPCYKRQCYLLTDQTQDPPCMMALSPEEVWIKLENRLKQEEIKEKQEQKEKHKNCEKQGETI